MGFQALKTLRQRSAVQAETRARLKAVLADALHLGGRDLVQVNEIACPDLGCPDAVTVVLVMREGRPTQALRIEKPLAAVTPEDCARVAEVERAQTD